MSEAKHTPGPWEFRVYVTDDDPKELERLGLKPIRMLTNDGQAIIMAGADDERSPVAHASCKTKYKRGEGYRTECAERDANARLIAAAPDILSALQVVLTDPCFPKLGTVTQDKVRSTIAKATGAA